jgi:hypothetical protein
LRIGWRTAEPPLPPCAVAAWGETAARLLERTLARARLDDLSGVAGDDAVVLIGATSALPWVDGVVYLGRHRDAPGLLFPTTEVPDAPLDLVARIVRGRVKEGDLPVAVVPVAVVPVGGPHPPASTRAPSPGGRRGAWLLYPLSSARPLGRAEIEAAILRLRGRS